MKKINNNYSFLIHFDFLMSVGMREIVYRPPRAKTTNVVNFSSAIFSNSNKSIYKSAHSWFSHKVDNVANCKKYLV